MTNKREQLASWTSLVADSGDLDSIRELVPEDATTNPSLLLKTAQNPDYRHLLGEAMKFASQLSTTDDVSLLADAFATLAGEQILQHIPGLVSTEVDARLSFDTAATVARARRIAMLYRELGVDRDRFLIKIAATWEGIRACEVLEEEGLRCNVTLLFSLEQAIAAAEAGATLVSPFVGRIHDWHVQRGTLITDPRIDDPGVQSVKRIYQEFKTRSLDTIVMGASFRNAGQIEALAGCDKLTIAPDLLQELMADNGPLERVLEPPTIEDSAGEPPAISEQAFRYALNDNAMANDLLSDGIRRFVADQLLLERLLQEPGP